MHRLVANMIKRLRTVYTDPQLGHRRSFWQNAKQPSQFGSLLLGFASLFFTAADRRRIKPRKIPQLQPIQAQGRAISAGGGRFHFIAPTASRHINPDTKTLPPAATLSPSASLWAGQQLLYHLAMGRMCNSPGLWIWCVMECAGPLAFWAMGKFWPFGFDLV